MPWTEFCTAAQQREPLLDRGDRRSRRRATSGVGRSPRSRPSSAACSRSRSAEGGDERRRRSRFGRAWRPASRIARRAPGAGPRDAGVLLVGERRLDAPERSRRRRAEHGLRRRPGAWPGRGSSSVSVPSAASTRAAQAVVDPDRLSSPRLDVGGPAPVAASAASPSPSLTETALMVRPAAAGGRRQRAEDRLRPRVAARRRGRCDAGLDLVEAVVGASFGPAPHRARLRRSAGAAEQQGEQDGDEARDGAWSVSSRSGEGSGPAGGGRLARHRRRPGPFGGVSYPCGRRTCRWRR